MPEFWKHFGSAKIISPSSKVQHRSSTFDHSRISTMSHRHHRARMLARWLPIFTPLATTCAPLCRTMPEPNIPPGGGANNHIIQQTQFHQGSLPRPEDFEAYDRVLRGAADRILHMAEKQAAHRQDLESRALKGDLTKAMMGTILAYIRFGGSIFGVAYPLLHDKPIQSLVALGSAFGPQIYVDFIQPKDEHQNNQPPPALPTA